MWQRVIGKALKKKKFDERRCNIRRAPWSNNALFNTVSHFLWSFELRGIKGRVAWGKDLPHPLWNTTCSDLSPLNHTCFVWQYTRWYAFYYAHMPISSFAQAEKWHTALSDTFPADTFQWAASRRSSSCSASPSSPPSLSLFSWSLCGSSALMIHVLILLCQGPKAASITQCPCLLLVLPALTLNERKLLLSSSTPDTIWAFQYRL